MELNKTQLDDIAYNIQFLIQAMQQPIAKSREDALEHLKTAISKVFSSIEGVEVKDDKTAKIDVEKVLAEINKQIDNFGANLKASDKKVVELESKIGSFTNIVKDLNERFNAIENKLNADKPLVTVKVFKGKEEVNGVELEYSEAKLPEKHFPSDSGFDGFVCFPDGFQTEEVIQPGETKKIPLGIQCEIPEGYEIQVRPRSGKTGDRINVGWGTIDSKYIGIIKANVSNDTAEPYVVKQGDKICQLVLGEVLKAEMKFAEPGEKIKSTERGSNGFGSSGR